MQTVSDNGKIGGGQDLEDELKMRICSAPIYYYVVVDRDEAASLWRGPTFIYN